MSRHRRKRPAAFPLQRGDPEVSVADAQAAVHPRRRTAVVPGPRRRLPPGSLRRRLPGLRPGHRGKALVHRWRCRSRVTVAVEILAVIPAGGGLIPLLFDVGDGTQLVCRRGVLSDLPRCSGNAAGLIASDHSHRKLHSCGEIHLPVRDVHLVGADSLLRVGEDHPGGDVELPVMPRASRDPTFTDMPQLAGHLRGVFGGAPDITRAQRRALVRAVVRDRIQRRRRCCTRPRRTCRPAPVSCFPEAGLRSHTPDGAASRPLSFLDLEYLK